jgi:hypothetical protein
MEFIGMKYSVKSSRRVAVRAAGFGLLLPLAALLASPAAMAQKIGTYTGTNNEGDEVQVVVASDGNGGLEISGLGDGGTVYCTQSNTTYGYGVGFSGNLAEIMGKKATFDQGYTNVAMNSNFKFKGNNVSGKMQFSVPILDSFTVAEACATKPQTFTASFGGAFHKMKFQGALSWPLASHK